MTISEKDLEAYKREVDLKIEKVAVQAKENMDDIKHIEDNYRRK